MNIYISKLNFDTGKEKSAAYDKYAAELLCRQRYEKYIAYKSERAAFESFAAGLLFQTGIEKLYGIGKDEIEIEITEKGKPYLKGHENIHFSISHTGQYAGIAIGDFPVGFDAECAGYDEKKSDEQKPDEKYKGIAKRFFSADETLLLDNSDDDPWLFRRLWAMKESYLKLTGLGFSKTLDSFSIIFDEADNDKNEMLTGYAFEHEKENETAAYLKCFTRDETAFSVCCYDERILNGSDIIIEEIMLSELIETERGRRRV